MKSRTTLILAGVFLALGVFLILVELPSEKKTEKKKEEAKKVSVFNAAGVARVSLKNPEGDFLFVKGDKGTWRISRPLDTEADQYAVTSLVGAVENLSIDRVLEEKPKDLSLYGLDAPRMEIALTFEGGKLPVILLVGKKSPLGSLYVKKGDENRVLLVGSGLDYTLNKKLFDFRDKTVVSFDRDSVQEIVLRTEKRRADVAKRDGGWVVLGTSPVKANEETVNRILSGLTSLRVEEFVKDRPVTLKPYGLDPPVNKVALILGKDKSQIEVRLGTLAPKRLAVYASATGKDSVFLLKSDAREKLDKVFDDLREMKAFTLREWDVEKFEIDDEGHSLEIGKDSSGHWHIGQAFGLLAVHASVQEMIKNLTNLKFTKIVSDAPSALSSYGLAHPFASVKLWGQGAQAPQTVHFGKKTGKSIFAKREGENAVYLAPEDILPTLKKEVKDILAPEEKASYEAKLKEKGQGKK